MQMMLSTTFLAIAGFVLAYESVNVNVSQPESSAPLNTTLAYYRLPGFNGEDDYLTHGFYQTECGSNLSFHYTDPSVWGNLTGTPQKPVLILTHGYPESSYIWRRMSQALSERVPVFIPDQCGYGLSTPCCNNTGCSYDKRSYSHAIQEALKHIYPNGNGDGTTTVIFAGHDRGARTMHRAAVDNNYPGIHALGLFVADIVPYVAEYASFSNPLDAIGYFHWSFLPQGEFATNVIMAYGGGNWVDEILHLGAGTSEEGIELFQADDAWAVYHTFFDQLSVTNSSVFDYKDGGTIDYQMQLADQNNNIKVDIPMHVEYSIFNLGKQFDVYAVWQNYTHPSAGLTVKGVGDNKGHFIVEEAPDETIAQLNTFMDRLGVDY